MKRWLFALGLYLVVTLVGTGNVLAGMIINTASLASGTYGTFDFPDPLEYDTNAPVGLLNLTVDWGGGQTETLQGFCVESQWFLNGQEYQIYSLSGLDSKYVQAAWLYDNYLNNSSIVKNSVTAAATQIAIWEVMFDSNYSLQADDFLVKSLNGDQSAILAMANTMLTALSAADLSIFNKNDYSITVSGDSQDFVLLFGSSFSNQDPAPTPEPSTLLLSGAGLVGLAAYRRRTKKSQPVKS